MLYVKSPKMLRIGIGLLLHFLLLSCSEGLRCLQCSRVASAVDCQQVITCPDSMECFTDEVVTSSGMLYNAGCREKLECRSMKKRSLTSEDNTQTSFGSRQTQDLVACSRCCSNNSSQIPCNRDICGFYKKHDLGLTTCYSCDNLATDNCNTIATCARDEVCGSQTHSNSNGGVHYSYGCYHKHPCVDATTILLQFGSSIGKRQHTFATCNVCCGDSLCNSSDCTTVFRKLKQLYDTGHLNITTLMEM